MIKTLTKIFAFSTIIKKLVETKKSKTEGVTQLHPSKIHGRTVYIREKEYFIRESQLNIWRDLKIKNLIELDSYSQDTWKKMEDTVNINLEFI